MARHPTGRRVQRDDQPDDAFIARLLELSAWAQRNMRVVIAGAVVLVLAITGGIYYRNYQQTITTQAELELMQVRMTAMSGNPALAIRDLEGFLTRFGGTRQADEARILLAQVYLEDGRPEDAAAAVESAAGNVSRPLGASAAFLLAAAYEQQGDVDQAETVYRRIADRAEMSYQRNEALDHLARIRLDRQDAAGAARIYEQLVEAVPEGSPDRAVFEMRLAEAQARAAGGS